MGLRFRKSFKAGPARVNLSKSGVGFSVGTKGYRVTKMANGRTRKTASIPGTGVSYVTESSKKKNDTKESTSTSKSNFKRNPLNHNNQPNKKKRWLYILLFIFFPPALIYFAWKKKHWTLFAKIICTAALSFYSLCWMCVIFPPDEKENQTPIVENENIPENPQEEEIKEPIQEPTQEPVVEEPAPTPVPTPPTEDTPSQEPTQRMVWVGETGTKYHSRANCSNMKNARQITIDDAEAQGYSPCKKCY